MRKLTIIAALMLAACGHGNNNNNKPKPTPTPTPGPTATPTPPPQDSTWYKKGWENGKSPYSHNSLNVGPNFYNLVADHEKWRAYHGDFDMVDGSAMRGWLPQDWTTYIGGPIANGPSSIAKDSWLQFTQSTHIKPWWDYANDYPKLWLVLNMTSMPTNSHGGTTLTAAEQEQIVDDIISGKKDADLLMLGRRIRYQIENLAGGAKAGHADHVMLRVNWEFQHTTSLGIGGKSFLNYYRDVKGLTELQAIQKYRKMMSRWITQVRRGYGDDVRLRVALSVAHMSYRGYPVAEMIEKQDDYDMIDMMFHPSKDDAKTEAQIWNNFYKPRTNGDTSPYRHWDAFQAAKLLNIAYGSLESGPRYEMSDKWGDLYTPERGLIAPDNWINGDVPMFGYRITDANNIYQRVGDIGNGKPTHTSGTVNGWAFRLNIGRKLAPYEYSELLFKDFHENSGRSAFVGSYHPTSANPNYVNPDWPQDQRASKSQDWKRFVEMRKRFMGKK